MQVKRWVSAAVAVSAAAALALGGSAPPSVAADKEPQTLEADFSQETGAFRGGASGTLYGLGDDGAPTQALLDGAAVENSSQKPPYGTQHPSGDALRVEKSFFEAGGNELAVYMQDYYPDWGYNGGRRPGDTRTYNLDITSPDFGSYTEGGNGVWDYAEVTEIVVNEVLENSEHPDKYTFIPFNEPDGGNWYGASNMFGQFLTDWDSEYELIQRIWDQYASGERQGKVRPTGDSARVAGPGHASNNTATGSRVDLFLKHAKDSGTLPEVFVWHELGSSSLATYRTNYANYRAHEAKYGIDPIPVNITEYGTLRDMSVPGQLIQWFTMFEDTKVQAETAYWNYAGNLSDNSSRANSANAGWWLFKWYADLKGTTTVKVTPPKPNAVDTLQGVAAIDRENSKATILYGGANDANSDQVQNTGAGIPVTVRATGLDTKEFGKTVDVVVRENAYTGTEGVAGTPRVVKVLRNVPVTDGSIAVTTPSVDRYAAYQLTITPSSSATADVDTPLLTAEAEQTTISGAQVYSHSPISSNWSAFIFSGNKDVGSFGAGDTLTWNVDAPAAGTYRLQIVSGNTGSPGTNGVKVNGVDAGTLDIGAELALRSAVKWQYRGSAELLVELKAGANSVTIEGSSLDNTVDKLLLYPVSTGADGADRTVYPAADLRPADGARLVFTGKKETRGFAALRDGSVSAYATAWDAGYYDIEVTYSALKKQQLDLTVNHQPVAELDPTVNGVQTTTIRVALSEGINRLQLAGEGISVKQIVTTRVAPADTAGIRLEAEDLVPGGTAKTVDAAGSNASGTGYVTGLGSNVFNTAETGPAGFGDRTRVVVLDANNTPSIREGANGTLTIPAGTVPAGSYTAVVRFSNDTFIGQHSYNPQILDLGLQIRDNSGHELASGGFRYTYTDRNFLNRSLSVTTDGGALTVGNWDEDAAHAVAPNIDSVTFYPLTLGGQTTTKG